MKKEFIPYELAINLKKLGFNEECFAYCNTTYNYDVIKEGIKMVVNSSLEQNEFTMILWQQAFQWFREKHNINVTIYSNASGYIWEHHDANGGTHRRDSSETGDCEMSGMFTTYEKAELECLKKLLELFTSKSES